MANNYKIYTSKRPQSNSLLLTHKLLIECKNFVSNIKVALLFAFKPSDGIALMR